MRISFSCLPLHKHEATMRGTMTAKLTKNQIFKYRGGQVLSQNFRFTVLFLSEFPFFSISFNSAYGPQPLCFLFVFLVRQVHCECIFHKLHPAGLVFHSHNRQTGSIHELQFVSQSYTFFLESILVYASKCNSTKTFSMLLPQGQPCACLSIVSNAKIQTVLCTNLMLKN